VASRVPVENRCCHRCITRPEAVASLNHGARVRGDERPRGVAPAEQYVLRGIRDPHGAHYAAVWIRLVGRIDRLEGEPQHPRDFVDVLQRPAARVETEHPAALQFSAKAKRESLRRRISHERASILVHGMGNEYRVSEVTPFGAALIASATECRRADHRRGRSPAEDPRDPWRASRHRRGTCPAPARFRKACWL